MPYPIPDKFCYFLSAKPLLPVQMVLGVFLGKLQDPLAKFGDFQFNLSN